MLLVELHDEEASVGERVGPLDALEDEALLAAERRNAEDAARHVGDAVEIEARSVEGPLDAVHGPGVPPLRQDGPVPGGRIHHGDLREAAHDREKGDPPAVGRAARRENARRPAHHERARPVRRRRVARLVAQPESEPRAQSGDREDAEAGEGEASGAATEGGLLRVFGGAVDGLARPCRGRRGRPAGRSRDTEPLGPEEAVGVELHLLQVPREVARRGVPFVRVLREAALDDPAKGGGKAGRGRGERLRVVADDGREGLGRRRAMERLLPRRELVEDQARRELVGAEVHGPSRGLLRRHVRRRSDREARRGEERGLAARERGIRELRDSEVEDLEEPLGRDHEVLGLQVAVDDADAVGAREPVHELGAEVQEAAHGNRDPPRGAPSGSFPR